MSTPHGHVTDEHSHEGDSVATHTHWLPHDHEEGEQEHCHVGLSDWRLPMTTPAAQPELPPCEVCGKVTHDFTPKPTAAAIVRQLVEALNDAERWLRHLDVDGDGYRSEREAARAALTAARAWLEQEGR